MVTVGRKVFEMTVVVVVEVVFEMLMDVVAVTVVVEVEVVVEQRTMKVVVVTVVVKDYCNYHCYMDLFYLLVFVVFF